MKTRNTIIFILILLIVAGASFVALNGIETNNFTIRKAKDRVELGLDLAGGVYVVLEAKTDAKGIELERLMEQSKAIINERINGLGVSEPNIAIEAGNRIRVEVAGIEDPQEAIDLIGKTAQLQFIDPNGNVVVTGKNVIGSEVQYHTNELGFQDVIVSLEFDKEGTKAFADSTTELSLKEDPEERIIYISLDDQIISYPIVQYMEPITNGKGFITGNFDLESANRLATLIRAGALPVEMTELQTSVIGPTLGLDAYDKSILAGGIALLLIFIFMILYYRIPGFIASLGLVIYVLLTIEAMVLIGVKLTLPGIAGLVLSIGMAVDANVIIFERIKEEIKIGKTIRTSVEAGFKRALASVMDSNITTLIAGLVLYFFGIGPIKGFGVTLIIGIITSMITAVLLSKYLLRLIVSILGTNNKKLYGGSDFEGKFNILKSRKIFAILSIIIIIGGMGMLGFKNLNYGIDFTGGTLIQIKVGKFVPLEEAKEIVDQYDRHASILHGGSEKDELIIKSTSDFSNETISKIVSSFIDKYNMEKKDNFQSEKFEPYMGKEIRNKAFLSILIASILMLAYISWRFEPAFGVAAIIALIHDILIMLAFYTIFRVPVNSSFIVAILTTLGYSINDTIVIFDRIRENKKFYPKESIENLINNSINQSLNRTINTSITTFVAVLILYLMGVEDIKVLALPLMIGIVAGTYSSVFIASPLWYKIKSKDIKTA